MVYTLIPEGELLPPRHGERQDDEDGHRRGIPLRQGAGTGSRLVFGGHLHHSGALHDEEGVVHPRG